MKCFRVLKNFFSVLTVSTFLILQLFRSKDSIPIRIDEEQIFGYGRELTTRDDSLMIRSWGCNRNEAPFIFVHVGKAGGGGVRARMAASALNVTKTEWSLVDESFYPIKVNGSYTASGKFCNSFYPNARTRKGKTYEGTIVCHAETPLARAIACGIKHQRRKNMTCCSETDCHAVYVGHNWLGSEMHWLPRDYLKRWWESNDWQSIDERANLSLSGPFDRKLRCPKRPNNDTSKSTKQQNSAVRDCSITQPLELDRKARRFFAVTEGKGEDWSFLYASMPVLRATVMRDPFSWLISKFFWHGYDRLYHISCDDIETATSLVHTRVWRESNITFMRMDWVRFSSLQYLMYLCGEDCLVRYERGKMDLHDIERQAAGNLRQSFAVVGLLNETETFYDMVNARVDYMNTSLNPHLQGGKHATQSGPKERYCKSLFADPEFQQRLIEACEEVAALVRLYELAVKVNRFQLKELQACGGI